MVITLLQYQLIFELECHLQWNIMLEEKISSIYNFFKLKMDYEIFAMRQTRSTTKVILF